MNRILVVIIVCLVSFQSAIGQKNTDHREQAWLGYFNQTRFTKHSGLWVDLHFRMTGDFINEPATNITRFGYVYYISDQVRVSAGHAFVRSYSKTNPDFTEQRPWQQIQWFEKKNGLSLMQIFRVEERYRPIISAGEVTDDYNFNWRFRYNFAMTIPLKGKSVVAKTPFLFLNDEVHVNAGKHIGNNIFDQNRLFIGLGYQFTSKINAHLGYLNVFQQLPGDRNFVSIDAVRLFVFHNIDLRKNLE